MLEVFIPFGLLHFVRLARNGNTLEEQPLAKYVRSKIAAQCGFSTLADGQDVEIPKTT